MRILYVTTISLTMNTFFKPHIDMLVKEGHKVDIACNCNELALDKLYTDLGCEIHQIEFSRSPLSIGNLKALGHLKKVVENGNYDIVHCHTPVGGVMARFAALRARKYGTKVIYTAHGFHFYKGAPIKNWLVYFPVEWLCSHMTDMLITINKEDYEIAKQKMKARQVEYIPGIGVDLDKFVHGQIDRNTLRREIGVPENDFLLLSVGELNENKNHQVIVKALAKLKRPNVHYMIAGMGDQENALLALASELGVSEQVHLLGYRDDIVVLNLISDVFCFPSIREGLGLAAIEALASGTPVVAAKNRGTIEYVVPNKNGFLCVHDDVDAFAASITKLMDEDKLRKSFSEKAAISVQRFHVENVVHLMKEIYGRVS